MKTFRVNYWQTDYGYFLIEAENKKEAKEKAKLLDSRGDDFCSVSVNFGIEDIEEEEI